MKSEVYRITGISGVGQSRFRTITIPHSLQFYFFLVGGTLRWKAPELLEGASTLTQATDVYAFAILCIEVLAMGQVPWCLDDDESVRHFVLSKDSFFHSRRYLINLSSFIYLDLNKRPAIPADFSSPLLHDFIEACWDKNPDNRPSFTSIIEKIRQLRQGAGESDDLLHTPTILEIPEHGEEMMPLSPHMSPKSFSPTFTCGYP